MTSCRQVNVDALQHMADSFALMLFQDFDLDCWLLEGGA